MTTTTRRVFQFGVWMLLGCAACGGKVTGGTESNGSAPSGGANSSGSAASDVGPAPSDDIPSDSKPGVSNASQVTIVAHMGERTSICAGTLVAPDVVVTARHCVTSIADTADGSCAFGSDADVVRVSRAEAANPFFARVEGIFVRDSKACAADIAVLRLANASPSAFAVVASRAPLVGDSLVANDGVRDHIMNVQGVDAGVIELTRPTSEPATGDGLLDPEGTHLFAIYLGTTSVRGTAVAIAVAPYADLIETAKAAR